jgi:manganese-dependent inorganic pyrophosphatase
VLVDTHHSQQLPPNFPYESVVEIIDHHPAGDVALFPSASIQNEKVGAAATLLIERLEQNLSTIREDIAGLLAAAVVSNTLNFNAPSTTERDSRAFNWLSQYVNVDQVFIRDMFLERSDISSLSTYNVLEMDYKQFPVKNVLIGISQFETVALSNFISRSDLVEAVTRFMSDRQLEYYCVNGVDIMRKASVLVAVTPSTQQLLHHALGASFTGVTASFPRILLRKTDLIPAFQEHFSKRNHK